MPTATNSRRTAGRGDQGFALMESIVSISLVSIVMAGLVGLFTVTLRIVPAQVAEQNAIRVAASVLNTARALDAENAVRGRDQAAVANQYAAAPDTVKALLGAVGDQAADPSAPAGTATTQCPTLTSHSCAHLPTISTVDTLGTTTFTVNTYTQWCTFDPVASPTVCTAGGIGLPLLNVLVDVSWPGSMCDGGVCRHVATTLIGGGR